MLNVFKARQYLLIVGLSVLSACTLACMPAKRKVPPSPEVAMALERFEKAERLFQKQSYSEALAIYYDHLKRLPKGPMLDTALMKTGTICMAVGDYPQARKVFLRLISQHPKSLFVSDARFNVIVTYYGQGDYNSALQYARSVLGLQKTCYQKFRIHNLMGHIYTASKQFINAIKSYVDAYELASQEGRAEVSSKMKEVISCLIEDDLNFLIDVYGARVPGGYLRLQLAQEYASDDRIEPALKVLSDFISLFPDHDELEAATAFREELTLRFVVDPFLIGCILPLSGPYQTFGNRALTGIEIALDRFNAQPDVNPIQLLIKDSKGDSDEAAAAVESLVLTHGAVGIIGPMTTSESAAIKAQALKVPIITLTQKSGITKLGDYVFRNFLTSSLQIKALVDYTVGDMKLDKFAILYPDERYGISFMNRFWDELIRYGAEVVGIESYAPEQTDFGDAIKKLVGLYYPRPEEPLEDELWDEQGHDETDLPGLAASDQTGRVQDELPEADQEEPEPIIDFQAIFIPDSLDKVGLIAPQLSYYDVIDVLLLGTNLWHSDKLIEMAGSFVQGAIVPDGFFLHSPSHEVQDFVKSYEEVFKRRPAFLETQAFDAAWILFQAVNQPEVKSRRSLKMALLELKDFPGITGLTSFDETGEVEKELYLLKVKGRGFIQIRP